MGLIDLKGRDVDEVIERGNLAFECRNCWHLSQVDVLGLIERFGAEALVRALRRQAMPNRDGFVRLSISKPAGRT